MDLDAILNFFRSRPNIVNGVAADMKYTDTPPGPAPGFRNDFSGAGAVRGELDRKYQLIGQHDKPGSGDMPLGVDLSDLDAIDRKSLRYQFEDIPKPLLLQMMQNNLDRGLNQVNRLRESNSVANGMRQAVWYNALPGRNRMTTPFDLLQGWNRIPQDKMKFGRFM